jgi:hypothetical protein
MSPIGHGADVLADATDTDVYRRLPASSFLARLRELYAVAGVLAAMIGSELTEPFADTEIDPRIVSTAPSNRSLPLTPPRSLPDMRKRLECISHCQNMAKQPRFGAIFTWKSRRPQWR